MQKTAYEMRISDWSSDVCSSDLDVAALVGEGGHGDAPASVHRAEQRVGGEADLVEEHLVELPAAVLLPERPDLGARQVHVYQEDRYALVLRQFGLGEGQADVPAGLPPGGAPHLPTKTDRASCREHGGQSGL